MPVKISHIAYCSSKLDFAYNYDRWKVYRSLDLLPETLECYSITSINLLQSSSRVCISDFLTCEYSLKKFNESRKTENGRRKEE